MTMRYAVALLLVVMTGPATAQPVGDALKLCRSDPVYGDSLRMSVADALRKEQDSEPDEADVDAMVDLARSQEVAKCLTRLSEDPSIFRALNGLSGFAVEAGWAAWRSQCDNVVAPKGACIEEEGRAGEELRSLNADPTTQRISGICQNLLSEQKFEAAAEAENRTWLACLKAGVKARPTKHALDECRFVSASTDTSVIAAMARCFRENAE
ncbi:hypothetical protein SAMN05216360_1274 [Methylobacterium phyllostachyos]|uniref:Lysozyme inhibitor LprI N-terminal domain-containing protein n=1 Tax=Methylobacterium phyllostachyos TaxID=582672 RepID=A0A1H0KGF3_9HYPH|nr:hypothetical protein [Methylobacterium phyllostachyos]SDO54985.1 hypothetical protein SAMN05216360_1274 [Methylobacterium phyllostachyos]